MIAFINELNRDDLHIPPCLAPLPACMDLDRVLFHLTQISRLQYQENKLETKHFGKPDLTSIWNSL